MSVEAIEKSSSVDSTEQFVSADKALGRSGKFRFGFILMALMVIGLVAIVAVFFFREKLIPKLQSKALFIPIARNNTDVSPTGTAEKTSPQDSSQFSDSLSVAPDPRLVEQARFGVVPKISEDGVKPREIYSRPIKAVKPEVQLAVSDSGSTTPQSKPRIGIIVMGAGLSATSTIEALITLPADITFAFSPYANNAGTQVADARRDGHEVMLEIPMESASPRIQDPGRMALLTGLEANENLERLSWIMSRFSGYFGLIPVMGERFLAQPEKLTPVLQDLSDRGLAMISPTTSPIVEGLARKLDLPFDQVSIQVDANLDEKSIVAELAKLEEIARKNGSAIGTMRPISITTRQLKMWIKTLSDKGIELVPVSAILLKRGN